MPSWRRVFTSDEARIESLAGASQHDDDDYPPGGVPGYVEQGLGRKPRDWPMPLGAPTTPPDDEALAQPDE